MPTAMRDVPGQEVTVQEVPAREAPLPAASVSAGEELTGELALHVATRGERSVAVSQFHRGSLRIMRPHYLDASGQVCFAVINPGGGYLSGDRYRTEIAVAPGASLLLTTQSATKVYRTPTAPARHHLAAQVGAGAVFESVPDPVIVYRDGSYEQTAWVEVDPEGSYIATEIVTPGWAPDGSRFGYRHVLVRTDVVRPGEDVPFLVDTLVLHPEAEDVPGLGGLDGFSHVGTMLVVDARVDAELATQVHELTANAEGVRVGVSLAPGPALAIRVLGQHSETVARLLFDIDALLRERWFGQERIELRKY